ncbi:hypothetical protein COCSADRAFT_354033 [Bipolaris sorokiniana ND90Pr]|uniref:Uncharacterized protein n=1 Tax=Cochliobolus sativus (strain ND90Pr / ATCC 201652) TaxID=665912 RepID=M2SWM9_COCSN|nr:uncharacterized protein COCSADRAFT_354033 [Bipolaris sorokiniana ND90Pr]EMD66700.1 hypothetical protein COCSADRAFT_354033 [Bipolaris sorokiniana ND90Pr]
MTVRRACFPKRSLLHRGSVGVEPGNLGAMQHPRPSSSWFSGKLEAPVTDATHASATLPITGPPRRDEARSCDRRLEQTQKPFLYTYPRSARACPKPPLRPLHTPSSSLFSPPPQPPPSATDNGCVCPSFVDLAPTKCPVTRLDADPSPPTT